MASSVTKQQVETGLANENEIVIAKGLETDDRVMLTAPADKDKLEMKTLPGAKPVGARSQVLLTLHPPRSRCR